MGQNNTIERSRQIQEAKTRLTLLEELYQLNRNVKRYFENGQLYYSYISQEVDT